MVEPVSNRQYNGIWQISTNQVIHQLMLVADVEIPVVLVFDYMN
jgi:hypothetical protein